MDIIALAGSRHATQDYGALRCVGSFNNAINFLTESARLLTLHRAGSGLSPMGWQLGARDFDRVRRAVPSVRRCAFSAAGITLDALLVRPAAAAPGSGAGAACGHCRSAADGGIAALHGAVRVARRAGPIGEAAVNAGAGRAGAGFSRWLRGDTVDWHQALGKGRG